MIDQIRTIYNKEINTSFKDSLTGLFNHGFFLVYLEQELLRINRSGSSFSLAMVDIDELGLHNQKQGPIEGDQIIRSVSVIIEKNIRGVDIAARYESGRLAIIFVGAGIEEALNASERIRASVEDEIGKQITVSIGISSAQPGINNIDSIIDEARSALIQAKIRGKNMVYCYRPAEKKHDESRSEILLVDDEPLNLKYLEGVLQTVGYSTHRAGNGTDALYIINNTDIDLVLLDIMMPDMDGFEVCNIIKTNDETRMIPVVLITALDDTETKIRGIEAGADDFITKPPNKPELLARVKSLLRLRMLNHNLTSIENVLFSMAKAVESKDSYTQGHVDRVSHLALSIGYNMGISEDELEALRFGGALHDIGKMGIPGSILNKPGPLDDDEWEVMKGHPEIGYKICLPLKKNLGRALDVVRHHHEKLDGTGYPDGLKNNEISMVARIMAVADIYDALVTDRPYRKAMSREKALDILFKEADAGKLDMNVVKSIYNLISDKKMESDILKLNAVA
ncbi:MAG: diguanylate cyclase [Desulfobacteraceae bacterium]|jgi:putative two-component system response regulator